MKDNKEYTVVKEWWIWSYDGTGDEFLDAEDVETFSDERSALDLAETLNRTAFYAWSYCTESRDLTEYICYCVKVFDSNGILLDVIEAEQLGQFKKCNMDHMRIKTATADYTGGGIYIYYGQFANGEYFLTDDETDYAMVLDANVATNYDDAFTNEWQAAHTIGYRRIKRNDIINYIITNMPTGNYAVSELKTRMI